MSVEGESVTFDESVPETHDVDPGDVDWQAIRDGYTGSGGLLDMSTRTDALTREVPGINNSRQAESLLAEAADRGFINERDGDYYIARDEADLEIDASDVDWENIFESVADGVGNPLPSSIKRHMGIKKELGLASEDQAERLVTDARDRGIIVRTKVDGKNGLYLSDAIENDSIVPSESNETVEPEPSADHDDEPEPKVDESGRPDPSEMPRSELEKEVSALRSDMTAMENRFEAVENRLATLSNAIFGDDHVPGDAGSSEDMLTKFVNLRDRVDEHDEKLTMVSSNSGSRSTPDERAMALRTALYEDAKSSQEKKATMTRDQAKYALNGGLSRAQLLDAMRRAADGKDADIDGSSDLEPVSGVEFVKGTGRSEQSRIRMILTQVTGEDLRKNLTTKQGTKGGE